MAVSASAGRRAAALALALALDAALGEPPARLHPVVWIGTAIDRLSAHRPRSRGGQLLWGAALAVGIPCLAGCGAFAVEQGVSLLPELPATLLVALALKPAFAVRALLDAGEAVEQALATGDLPGARRQLRALVSRPTEGLDASLAAAAAIESLAENLGDSVFGPVLAFALFGLAGAWGYRALNTLDSMLGYHGELEWLGKASARLDDAASAVSARAAALAIALCAPLAGGSVRGAWRMARRDRRCTASPNAGWPMAAMAGALDRRLEKTGHYVLHREGMPPSWCDIARTRRLTGAAACAGVAGAALLALVRLSPRRRWRR
jgi:adenosylcobinamide-phosphate synthase